MPPKPGTGPETAPPVEEGGAEEEVANNGKLTTYDPTRAKTPRKYGKSLTQYAQWVEMQGRRVGGTIATELYVKPYGRQVVLYMVMHDNFTRQSYDVRELTTEMLWRMWSRRLREDGKVWSLQDAHLVLVDKHNSIIGGSSVKSASELWVKR